MAEQAHAPRKLPNDMSQLQVVWRYELLKYLRSRRLIASIVIVIAILALIYVLPPAVGSPYRGEEVNSVVSVVSASSLLPGQTNITLGHLTILSYGMLKSGTIDTNSLHLFLNGTEYPSDNGANWVFMSSVSMGGATIATNAVLFTHDLTGQVVTATYTWHTPVHQFDSLFVNFVNILVVICATFFGADSIVGEFQNRTGYLMFPNPLRKSTLFFGKYAASLTAGIAVIALFYAGVALLSATTVGGVDSSFPLSLGFAIEYLVAVMAVAYLISSILKGSTGALVLTFFMFVMILPIVDNVSMFAGVKLEASLTFAAGTIVYSLSHPYPVDSVNSVRGFTIHQYYPDPAIASVVMLAYAVVALAISLVLFKRKQLVG